MALNFINNWLENTHAWLMPPVCVLCGQTGDDGQDLCAACRTELPYNTSACVRCALPLPATTHGDLICGACQQQAPAYDRGHSLLRYAPPADQLIQRLKFNARLPLARVLGELMAVQLVQRLRAWPERIIPVPLHRARLRERGFNQALEIARPIARALNIPLDYRGCERMRHTSAQSLLPAAARRKNIKGAFRVIRPIKARHVAIVDDVMTTGHTVQEFAATLRKSGVEQIDVWVVARAALRS